MASDIFRPIPQIQLEQAVKSNIDIRDDAGDFKDAFWDYSDLRATANYWSHRLPYRLKVWKRVDGNWTNTSPFTSFILPIPPESLTVSVPYAITTTVTLGGIVEEHNGAPLRTIVISGTTGVTPLRGTAMSEAIANRGASSIPASIFAGTLSGVSSLASSVEQLGTGNGKTGALIDTNLDETKDSSGYMQFKLLQRFLEAYIALKKTSKGRDYVLVFEMWKDAEMYFVTPVSFELRRSTASPLEYQYSIIMKAWKRQNPGVYKTAAFDNPIVAKDLNNLAKAMNSLELARGVLEGARKVLTGIRADINESLFTPIRESVLFVKDILGVALTAVDLPSNIISDMKGPIAAASGVAGTLKEFGGVGNRLKNAGEGLVNAAKDMAQAFQNLSISSGASQTGSPDQQDSGSNQQSLEDGSPAHKGAANPDDNFEFFKTIKPGTLNLSPHTQKKITDEKLRVRKLKREDFEARRDLIAGTLTDFQDSIGLGNATYTRIYGLTPKTQLREASESDFDVIFALNATVIEMNRLAASSNINRDEVSAIDYIAGLASRSGIAFKTPKSKFLVPFPYGHTLEQISKMYLGTEDRWHEIAALNGLLAPYVDETGFTLPLLTNGNGNTVTVSDGSKLFVNQPVWISSTAVGRIKQRITKIEPLSPGLVAVTMTGDSTLSQFTVGAGAAIQAFLPNTVNSQQSLFIPSDEEVVEEDYRLKSVPGVDHFDPLLRVGGIDLLLTQSGDLVITPDGDTRLAVGLTNIVQKVRLVIDTTRGSLLHHPDYGFPSILGESTADVSATDLLKICKDLFRDDPTFTGVESAAILKDGPVCKITLSVGIAGTQQVIPITVEIPR